jgi:hypothetical protein
MFNRHEINPFNITDKVTFRNIDRTVNLTVRADAMALVRGLTQVNATLSGMTSDTPEEEQRSIAHAYAAVIFGAAQADALVDLYDRDPVHIIQACNMYFTSRLAPKLTKIQKRQKMKK